MQISDMIPGLNIIGGKVIVASINGAGGSGGGSEIPAGFLGDEGP